MLAGNRRRVRWQVDHVKAVDDAGLQGCVESTANQVRNRFADGDIAAFCVCFYFLKDIIIQRKSGSHVHMMH